MRRCLVLFLLLFLSTGILASDKLIGLSEEDFEGGLEVVVKTKGVSGFRAMSGSFEDAVSYEILDVAMDELDDLLGRDDVIGVYSKFYIMASMSEVVGIINSSVSNNLQVDSLNLTGSGQVVCIIDTGVNFSHPDLLGKNVSCVVDCYNKACVEDCSVSDDNGHGTHVAGIVGASGNLIGVAPNVSLIGVKILGSDGGGSGNDNDLPNAVDYCVAAGADVISMSLGTVSVYSSACDSVSGIGPWKTAVDTAVAAGIPVVVASGNDASLIGISAPACLSSAIPVGDTYDANVGGLVWGGGTCTDATTTVDKIVCHANRNSLVKLFAPGALVNSTWYAGGYREEGGTSMATPVVSGAIAILRQYFNLSSQGFTPSEIEDVLNDSGKIISDAGGSGLNFSRIDVYNALISVDESAPEVELVSPSDNDVSLNVNQSFVCNISDWQLSNLTFELWNSSGALINSSVVNVSGVGNSSVFNVTNLSQGDYVWNCFGEDLLGNAAWASSNFSLTIGGIDVDLVSPENDSWTNVNYSEFNCSVRSDGNYSLANLSFFLWNSSGFLLKNESMNVSGFSNSSVFNWTFLMDDSYVWECVGVNNNSNEGDGVNYTVTYDSIVPVISSVSSGDPSTSDATISWMTNESCNSSLWISGGLWTNSSSFVTSHSVAVSGLSSGSSYSYVVFSCDKGSNCVNSSGSFSTDSESSGGGGGGSSGGSSGGGGGGSSSSGPTVYSVNASQLSVGYTKSLRIGNRIEFDLDGEEHSVSISRINDGVVSLLIQSEPVYVKLSAGESVKLNLSSADYYNLEVGVVSVSGANAVVVITAINEVIEQEVVVDDSGDGVVVDDSGDGVWLFYWVVVGLVVVWAIRVLFSEEKEIKKKVSKKERGKGKKVEVEAVG